MKSRILYVIILFIMALTKSLSSWLGAVGNFNTQQSSTTKSTSSTWPAPAAAPKSTWTGTPVATPSASAAQKASPKYAEGSIWYYTSQWANLADAKKARADYQFKQQLNSLGAWDIASTVTDIEKGGENYQSTIKKGLDEYEKNNWLMDDETLDSILKSYGSSRESLGIGAAWTDPRRNIAEKKPVVSDKETWVKTDGAMVKSTVSPTSSKSQFSTAKEGSVRWTPSDLNWRLSEAIKRYGKDDPRVQKLQKLVELKNSRASNSTTNTITTPNSDSLTKKIDDKDVKDQVWELELTDRNKNLQEDRIDTANEKASDLSTEQASANKDTEKTTKDYTDEYKAEYDSYKAKLEERESQLMEKEKEMEAKIKEWNKTETDALANQQMGQQAEATQKLWKLGASETVLANAQNEIRNDPNYQKQRAALQKQYIDTIMATTKEYQGMYRDIMSDKTSLTDAKRDMARELITKINDNREKINTIRQNWIAEMYKPVESFQDARLEDSNNAELSAKQNSEAQYRWAGMDESGRIAKLKDALYNYDSSISRAWLSPADFEAAAKESDITKAVAMLANTAKNLTKAQASGSSWKATGKASDTADALAQALVSKWYKTVDQVTKALSASSLSDTQKAAVLESFKEKLWWKVPLREGVTQYQNNATVDAALAAKK